MESYSKKFTCNICGCEDFVKVHNFIMDFRNVDFTDDIICNPRKEEVYRCDNCGEPYSIEYIQDVMTSLMFKYKDDEWSQE
jgi:transcription elongation factor Elf1